MTWRRRLPPGLRDRLAPQEPRWTPPMLATLVQDPPRGERVHERKLDGYRILAVCGPDGATLRSRRGHDVTRRYPLTAGLPRRDCVLDGEVVAFGPGPLGSGGRDSFAAVARGEATHLVLFDVLNLDAIDVRRLPWTARRALLDEVDLSPPCVRLPHATGGGEAMLERACALGWEGLVAKDPDAPYTPGRSRAWLKMKCIRGQEFVVGGFTEPGGARRGLGALLVGYHDESGGGLRYAGKVGTGFDDATLAGLRPRLDALEQSLPPFLEVPRDVARDARWVRPDLVCRVDFTEWTPDGRLRHPRFLGLRDDKPAVEVTRAG